MLWCKNGTVRTDNESAWVVCNEGTAVLTKKLTFYKKIKDLGAIFCVFNRSLNSKAKYLDAKESKAASQVI